ncbi:hypothetical protein BDZ89DRAFT_1132845 [Hymenopellis radicata]|nr:hypothetical protein BDZ89DRAFT_1132845 [Hymenopellis radicata]
MAAKCCSPQGKNQSSCWQRRVLPVLRISYPLNLSRNGFSEARRGDEVLRDGWHALESDPTSKTPNRTFTVKLPRRIPSPLDRKRILEPSPARCRSPRGKNVVSFPLGNDLDSELPDAPTDGGLCDGGVLKDGRRELGLLETQENAHQSSRRRGLPISVATIIAIDNDPFWTGSRFESEGIQLNSVASGHTGNWRQDDQLDNGCFVKTSSSMPLSALFHDPAPTTLSQNPNSQSPSPFFQPPEVKPAVNPSSLWRSLRRKNYAFQAGMTPHSNTNHNLRPIRNLMAIRSVHGSAPRYNFG